ncbi:hypothetical protein MY092_005596 [Salmonella enterica]|nr:hypothetical protein [Salmonella enterica]EKQ9928069.1 hypothetical protein [Salmonella enterica subsp. enterica serovar Panama]
MMTHCHTTPTDAHAAKVETLRRVLQQAIDQYPRLAAFLLTLPGITPEAVPHFHEVVYQQIRELAATRQLSGRPVPRRYCAGFGRPRQVRRAGCYCC